MTTYETLQRADADKLVHLSIPVDEANRDYRLVVLIQRTSDENGGAVPPLRSWPNGFFEATAGMWDGELERPPQGEFETREEL